MREILDRLMSSALAGAIRDFAGLDARSSMGQAN